jgi:hypothetical protein
VHAGSGDAMPQRTKADAMTQGGRRTHGHPRRRNSASIATRAGAEEGDLGEEGSDGWVPTISVGGAVMGGRSGSHAEMGQGGVEAGRRRGKWLANTFPI